ncbi:Hpt domain-containing protein [Extensimonas perlucida]|uniref:hybrid sensor histidine kinase/response regulator n=1 Tax=Extensimonas perlucida TaxID=2590786 RepID=UPI0011A3D9F3|nr:Hpt domain-containing protein [Extensimonas perlucida]
MPSLDVNHAPATEASQQERDLGPLAWVLEELRKSLDAAVKTMRRFVHEAEHTRESDLAALDAGALRIARQQLHQASGALEMVGMAPAALLLRAMEAAVHKFVQQPPLCTRETISTIERAGFALVEYLEYVLAGKQASAVALFPQYREVQTLAGAERVHPADLWPTERRIREPEFALSVAPLAYGSAARARLDAVVLQIVKSGDAGAARSMRDICLGFAAAQADSRVRTFWKVCAGFFEALAGDLLPPDVYVKRVASRVLMQYATLAKGEDGVADRLLQDLLFFCAQASTESADTFPALTAVRQAFGLHRFEPVRYEVARFGRFDPGLLAQARKRMATAAEVWSALAGGDRAKLKPAVDQFSLVCDSLRKLLPGSEDLAQALAQAVDATARTDEPPAAPLAMEVATAILYLQAAFEELDADGAQMEAHFGRLAERLRTVLAGAEPEPLEAWIEDLYRSVSDKQTMGSVVNELRASLAELEKALDQFFRTPQDTRVLVPVPGQMAQMRGVLSVLGLEQAVRAMARMREVVERLLAHAIPEEELAQTFEKLGNSLGTLGFLIDMLSYQRNLARKLFIYDEAQDELRMLTGKTRVRATDDASSAQVAAQARAGADLPPVVPRFPVQAPAQEPTDFAPLLEMPGDLGGASEPAQEDAPASEQAKEALARALPATLGAGVSGQTAPSVPDAEDDELLEVFLEEAREVVAQGLAAIAALQEEPGNLSEQTTLRRAFHTLKGSSRMVGLNEFGEAAWSMEQVLNAWLAEQKPIPAALLELAGDALRALGQWADDIAAGVAAPWQAQAFRTSADAMRLHGTLVPLESPSAGAAMAAVADAAQPAVADLSALQQAPHVESSESEVPEAPAEQAGVAVEAVAPQEPVAEIPFAAEGAATMEAGAAEQAQGAEEWPALELPENAPGTPPQGPVAEIPFAAEVEEVDFSAFAAAQEQVSAAPQAPIAEPLPEAVAQAQELTLEFASLPEVALPAAAQAGGTELPGAQPPSMELLPAATQTIQTFEPRQEDGAPKELEEFLADLSVDVLADLSEGPSSIVPSAPQESSSSMEAPPEVPVESAAQDQDAVKVIGDLRIGAALYNVYLNEADEWSHELEDRLQAWSLELHAPVPDMAVARAHALAGASATVGFQALSDMARLLEHALQHVQLQPGGTPEQARVFLAAAQDMRRLLHQFAAGFLKEPSAQVLEDLHGILAQEVPSGSMPLQELEEEFVEATTPYSEMAAESAPAPTTLQTLAPAADLESPHAGVAATASAEVDDEADASDAIDPDLFPIFEEEAQELLPRLGTALRQWAAHPSDLEARNAALRVLHTFKGSARLAGAMRLGARAHRLESLIEQLDVHHPKAEQIEPLLGRFDALRAHFDALCAQAEQESNPPLAADAIAAVATAATEHAEMPAPESAVSAHAAPQASPALPAASLPGPAPLVIGRAQAAQSVRVRAQLLDRLVNQAGEVVISRARLDAQVAQLRSSLADLTGNLERLRQQLRDIEVQAESQMQSRLAQAKDSASGFDPLEFDRFTRVQELTRMMAESVNDIATVQRNLQRSVEGAEDELSAQARQARELQRDLLRTRMVEFDAIAERLYAVVRQAGKELGKQVRLELRGGSFELDRGVLERMAPAFEHLLRNAVAHGIEPAEQRQAQGKPAAGTIIVDVRHEGNDVAITFRDDGAGLDLPRIRAKAIAQGLLAPDAELGVSDAANLIFQSGFSTAADVTGIAGRGVGMDVVRAEVNALGGRIETSTEAGQGTAFRLVLPLTTAVTQVVMLRAGELTVGMPANLVEIVRRATAVDLEQAYRSGFYEEGGERLPFFWAGALLQSSVRSKEPVGKNRPVVIVRSAAQRIALHVDEVLGNQEVVVKQLGPQLSRLPGLAGMSLLASGAVVLIYNPVALATVYGERVRAAGAGLPAVLEAMPAPTAGAPMAPAVALGPSQVPLVLVVDDSITVRRVTQRLLQREGYRVALATDGLQALERLQQERPAVVLSDIEMPRMDGFDLLRNIRADQALHDLPVIMITSRIAHKHREHAHELGANHYLGKPYSDEELLGLVAHYARQAAAVQA